MNDLRRARLAVAFGIAALTLAAGCGISKEEFAAKELEAQQYKKKLDDESEKAAALEQKVKDLSAQVKANEDNLSAKQSDLRSAQEKMAELQALNDELSKSKKKLEQAKEELEKRSAEYEQLAGTLKGEIEAGKIELSELKGKMTLKMKDKILFASGSATIGKEGREALSKVAEAFKGLKGKIVRVEGHTDNVPTSGGAFPTNWELSNARATAVVRFLQEKGVDPTLLAAAGYSQYQPIATNETAEGRSQNRRIEIVLAPAEGASAPTPAARK